MDGVAGHVTDVAGVASPLLVRAFQDSTPHANDTAVLRARATDAGYLFFRGLVDAALVRRLRREILTLFAERGWLIPGSAMMDGRVTSGAVRHALPDELSALQVQIQLLPVFRQLRVDPAIMSVLERIFAAPPREGFGDVCRIMPPEMVHRTTPPHQDHFYTRGSTSQWTVWLPVGSCPVALGGLVVWPGSHRDGLRSHDRPIEDGHAIVVAPDVVRHGASYRAGDALLFNALTVHQARPNVTTDRVRVSVDYRYAPDTVVSCGHGVDT